jgi:hypothetical protein
MTAVSGLAASIRASVESETFDLAGQNVSTITSNIEGAFAEPFPLKEMIRITFITGAGKLARQKYDDGAAKAVTSTLRKLGYEDDSSASCVNECGGTFKLQHDTGKNLKTVVVFPNISGEDDGDNVTGDMNGMKISETASLLPEGSPEQVIAMSSKAVFERMLTSKCPTWSQKKGCLAAIEDVKKLVEELDAKLLSGTPLTDAEQDMYDSVSVASLDEKEAYVKSQMHTQVENGNLTTQEREMLLIQVSEKIETLNKEIAESSDKPKKLEKLTTVKKKATERQSLLEDVTPKAPPRLRHEAEIQKLRVELSPLLQLEEGAKGRLLSVKETQTLARKDEILEEIEELENSSRGWFEDDEAFEVRVAASRAAAAAKAKQKSGKKSVSTGTGYKATSASKWVVPGAQKKTGGTGAWGKPAAKKKPAKGGNVFAAMMMDSDSD